MANMGFFQMNYAELCQHSPEIKKAFFDLGWEYYAAKQGVPNDVDRYPAFLDGFNAAKERIRQVRGDRFHLKWLQIRYGALKRNRIFDSSVTPDMIKKMDVKACPVTLMPLTHSTFTDSDWSLDRICNSGGYVLGNLVIVSTKANKAKGTMSFNEIYDCSQASGPTNGLTPLEWKRWLAISSMSGTRETETGFAIGYHCAPLIIECPPMLIMNPSSLLQYVIATKAYGYRDALLFGRITEGLSKESRKNLNALVREAAKLSDVVRLSELDVWNISKLFKQFNKVFKSLDNDQHVIIMENYNKQIKVGLKVSMNVPAWNPALKGYNQNVS